MSILIPCLHKIGRDKHPPLHPLKFASHDHGLERLNRSLSDRNKRSFRPKYALKNNEDWVDKNDPDFGQPTLQALAAQEVLVLYNWWKEERPNRPDPADISGWRKYCEETRNIAKAHDNDTLNGALTNKNEDKRSHHILTTYSKVEKEQEEEDTAILIRLIKIRQSLWT